MIKIKKKARFITDFYGSAPAAGALQTVIDWIGEKEMKGLMSFAEQTKKKGEEANLAVLRILSVFHRNDQNCPILGNWMLKRCLIETGWMLFNAQTNREHPKKDKVKNGIIYIEPMPHIAIHNGKATINKPHGIETYAMTTGAKKSFFKAYEKINRGSSFSFVACFDDNLLKEEHINLIVETAGRVGVGAFRERFGKFEYV